MLDYSTLARLFAEARGHGDIVDTVCPECSPRCRRNGNAKKLRIWRHHGGDVFGYKCARCGIKGGAGAKGRAPSAGRFTSAGKPQSATDPAANTPFALALWRRTRPAPGTLVEIYLQARGITMPIPSRLRFHPHLKHPNGTHWPGAVALVTDATDRAVAVHRTWIAPGGHGKAPIEPVRMSLGPTRGGAVRLVPATTEVVISEGLETGLSIMLATGRPTWAALSAAGIRALVLPPTIKSVIIAADNDDAGEGRDAAQEAAQRWLQEGRRVRLALPPAGQDYNDVLVEGARR
jgi:putative DNA primase/helicase